MSNITTTHYLINNMLPTYNITAIKRRSDSTHNHVKIIVEDWTWVVKHPALRWFFDQLTSSMYPANQSIKLAQ